MTYHHHLHLSPYYSNWDVGRRVHKQSIYISAYIFDALSPHENFPQRVAIANMSPIFTVPALPHGTFNCFLSTFFSAHPLLTGPYHWCSPSTLYAHSPHIIVIMHAFKCKDARRKAKYICLGLCNILGHCIRGIRLIIKGLCMRGLGYHRVSDHAYFSSATNYTAYIFLISFRGQLFPRGDPWAFTLPMWLSHSTPFLSLSLSVEY